MSEIVAEGVADPDVPQTLLDVFTPIVDESKIHFNSEGIQMRAVDPSNIAMSWADLSETAFGAWDAPGAVTIGTNLGAFEDRLGVADDSVVSVAVDMESRYLVVETDTAEMEMALIDPEAIRQEPDMPDLDLPNTVVLSRERLAHAFEVVDMVSDHIEIVGDPDTGEVQFVGEGDTDGNTVSYGRQETEDGTELNDGATSLFSMGYMTALVDGIPKGTEVTMRFGEEWPVKLEWTAMDGRLDVTQMCAPRIRTK